MAKGGVRKRAKSWSYYFDLAKVDGKRKIREKSGFATKAEAEKALVIALNEYERHGKVFDPSDISFSDYIDMWMDKYVDVSCKYNTKVRYLEIINAHIKPKLGNYKLKNISPVMLQDFLSDMYRDGYARNTLKSVHGVFSKLFMMAVHPYGLIRENTMQYVTIKDYKFDEIKEDESLSKEQIETVLNWLSVQEGLKHYVLPLSIAYMTGMRKSEVLGLTWDNIDFKNRLIKVRHNQVLKPGGKVELGTPKTKSSIRDIAIGKTLLGLLENEYDRQQVNYINSDFVCIIQKDNKPMTKYHIEGLTKRIKKELGIHLKFHALRHHFGSKLYEIGVPVTSIQEHMGHSTYEITMDTYVKNTNDAKYKTIELFEQSLL